MPTNTPAAPANAAPTKKVKEIISVSNCTQIVGERIIKELIKLKIIKESNIKKIKGVPFTLIYEL